MRASGYGRRQEGLVNADFIDMSIPYSAGSLYSTTHDLWTWEKALYSGKLISPASLKKMTASFKDNYGFGLFIRDEKGRKQFWHNGSINGFATALAWYPDHRLAIVALSNIAPGAATQMLSQLADVVFGRPVLLASERKEVSADPKVLARYIGRYELRPDFVMEISQEGDHLFAQATKQSKIPLFAESEKTFFSRVVDAQITFEVNNDGPAAALLLHQGGRDIRAKRLP
ncbi:MAG TPA: serine hydrolase [Rhizomicrobium sp.]|nr:serine hydrolase [Rhizomicrobium sp.]